MPTEAVQTSVTHPATRAAFGTGGVPTIALVNAAKTSLGYDFTTLVAALQTALDKYFAPVWGTPALLTTASSPKKVPAGAWPFLFVDTAKVAGALGYHDLTKPGLPVSFVFVKTTLDDGGDVAVTASHELWEVLVDPGIQMWADGPKGELWAYETADAVDCAQVDQAALDRGLAVEHRRDGLTAVQRPQLRADDGVELRPGRGARRERPEPGCLDDPFRRGQPGDRPLEAAVADHERACVDERQNACTCCDPEADEQHPPRAMREPRTGEAERIRHSEREAQNV